MTQETTYLTLRPKKSSAIWLMIGSILFVICGIWMAQEKGWIGYLCAGFFALGIPVAIFKFNKSYLRLSDDGISFTTPFQVTNIPWHIVDSFFVVSIRNGMHNHKLVGFNFVPSYEPSKTSRRISSTISQCEAALLETYGKKAEELADILNRYLEEFTRKNGEDSD